MDAKIFWLLTVAGTALVTVAGLLGTVWWLGRRGVRTMRENPEQTLTWLAEQNRNAAANYQECSRRALLTGRRELGFWYGEMAGHSDNLATAMEHAARLKENEA